MSSEVASPAAVVKGDEDERFVAAGRRTTPRRHRDRTAASGRDCDRVPSWCDEKNQWVFDVAERVVAEPVAGLMTNAHFKRQTRAVERSRTDGVEHDDEYPRAASNCSGSAARGDQENYCEPEKGQFAARAGRYRRPKDVLPY
jgi:hypothetical protein